MDYTSAAGYVTDAQGRRQYADRDIANGVPGTSLVAADLNALQNTLAAACKAYGIALNVSDDTLLAQAIAAAVALEAQRASTVESNLQQSLGGVIANLTTGWTVTTAAASIVVPDWATKLECWLTGGGGGSAGIDVATDATYSTQLDYASSGGGGAGTAWGTAGGATTVSVGGTLVVTAGGGDRTGWEAAQQSSGGSGGTGTINAAAQIVTACLIAGGDGADGQTGSFIFPGLGGGSHWGGGARAGNGAGVAGRAYGAGGGGAYGGTPGTSGAGGVGATGVVLYRFRP